MKKMYFFCSIIVIFCISLFSSSLMYSEIKAMKNSLSKAEDIGANLVEKNRLLELSLAELEGSLQNVSENNYNSNSISDASDNAFYECNESSKESFLIIVENDNIYVYENEKSEPLYVLPITDINLSKEQLEELKKGISLNNISEIYSYMESITS